MIHGQMTRQPLLISSLLRHAERHHGEKEIVSRRIEGGIHCYTYRDLAARARKMAKALLALGMAPGDRVATLAWNGYRHMELYYAVSGADGVLHTLDPKLHPGQLAWIVADAHDQILCFDLSFLLLLESMAGELTSVRHFVLMSDRSRMPSNSRIPGLLCYDDLCAAEDDAYEWPEFDENCASSLCYTSGPGAIRKACFTATGRRSCTPWRELCRMCCACPRTTLSWRVWSARSWSFPVRRRRVGRYTN
jgi:fatty-acyl-CoA synthase